MRTKLTHLKREDHRVHSRLLSVVREKKSYERFNEAKAGSNAVSLMDEEPAGRGERNIGAHKNNTQKFGTETALEIRKKWGRVERLRQKTMGSVRSPPRVDA